MLLDAVKLLPPQPPAPGSGPWALMSPRDTVLWELHQKVVTVKAHGEKVSLPKTTWQPPLWAGKCQRYTGPTDLKPENHTAIWGQKECSSDLIQTLEAEIHFPVTFS